MRRASRRPGASPLLRSQISPVPARVAAILQGDVSLDANGWAWH